MSTLSVRLPESLHKKIKELAEKEGVSMNQFITLAVSEKMSALLTLDYLKERAERADETAFKNILEQVSDVEPDEYDKI